MPSAKKGATCWETFKEILNTAENVLMKFLKAWRDVMRCNNTKLCAVMFISILNRKGKKHNTFARHETFCVSKGSFPEEMLLLN